VNEIYTSVGCQSGLAKATAENAPSILHRNFQKFSHNCANDARRKYHFLYPPYQMKVTTLLIMPHRVDH